MLTNENKAFFIILTNQNCALKQSKAQKIPVKACFRDSCKVQNLQ